MRKLVRDLRRVRAALGTGVKAPLAVEKKPLFKMGKKLVAARRLAAGQVLSAADVAIKSPNDGLPPYELPSVLGRTLQRDLAEDDSIAFEDLL
jgi:N-acetylneuraminate synthase/sialic acid synthase